ncbi:DUF1156 domain-containing protein, partial [Thermopolyspora sp. NPDC052614]|uniref:DUF1156 domain-containing protein n=1 Tax=Thermopolyspora sp. NPDC052614 TaxID=3155682 RepID=UPI0034449A90
MSSGMGTGSNAGPTGYRRKLIEVALPLEEINKQSAREKSIRQGHPSTLHLWWARRPLAACRAVLFAQLVDDPSSRPEEFPTEEDQALERKRLFGIIENLVNWDNINDKALYEEARKEIQKSCNGDLPPILDPFAGGGSIPLEAQRLGLEAHASDLNPVAVLINKALIETPAKWAGKPPVFPGAADSRMGNWQGTTGLAEDVRRYGKWMRDEAERRIGNLYPKVKLEDGTEADVIAWIWARTITCPSPACGGTMPLVRSFWLGTKKGKERYVFPVVEGGKVRFEIRGPQGSPPDGTVNRGRATCLICNSPVQADYIQQEGKAGRMRAQLMAIAAEGPRMRYYVAPTEAHVRAAEVARPGDIPEGDLVEDPRNIWCVNYGLDTFDKLFTDRQLVALATFSDLVSEVRNMISREVVSIGHEATREGYADAVAMYLALAVSRLSDYSSTLATWSSNKQNELLRGTFARQALPMTWDYGEANVFGLSSGTLDIVISAIAKSIELLPYDRVGVVDQHDAMLRRYDGMVVSTDPPYYDNICYADLSDFFYVWLRRSLRDVFPTLFGTLLTPKNDELVASAYRHGGKEEANHFFEDGFQRVFEHVRQGISEAYPMTVFYAFKQSESDARGQASTGWETFLEGMIRSGWAITATWPIRTERTGRTISVGTNALASSVVLSCRPRAEEADTIDRRGLINTLKSELPSALRDLQQGGIAPVDLAQAAIGPGMAVFSRYRKVIEPDGSPMRVRAALVLINQILAEVLSEQEGDFDPDTRFCIKWFETHGFDDGKFGDAETVAKAMDISVAGLARAGVLKARAGIVQLINPAELPEEYDPLSDARISVWEVVMHLAKRLDEKGIEDAGQLMAAAKSRIDLDTAKELAYLLFSICEKRNWPKTALLF